MSKVVLLCGGGHCKVVIDNLQLIGETIVGVLDDNPKTAGRKILGYPVIGPIKRLSEMKKKADFAVIATTDPGTRKKLAQKCRDAGFEMRGFIHPTAVISASATISSTAQICAGAIINPMAKIEENTIINTLAVVEHDCLVGPYCHIAPSASLMGNVRVGSLTMIGASTVIIPNLSVGSGVVVGAGATIIKDLEDNSRYSGAPARRRG